MRIFIALLILLLPKFAVAAGFRLDPEIRPTHYTLRLAPDLSRREFSGHVTIALSLGHATSDIELNAVELLVTGPTLRGASVAAATTARIVPDAAHQTVHVALDRPVGPGAVTLELDFAAPLSQKLHGFYAAEANGETFAFTDFEPTDARRAFPCFDEPAFKATFAITAVIADKLVAVSNRPIATITRDAKSGKQTIVFEETAPLSTYLIALAVGPLVSVSTQAGPIKVSVWGPRGTQHAAKYALQVAAETLPLFEKYFGIAYPYGPKLDLVAVPDFLAGAMENAGAIFFRQSRLLVDDTATVLQKHRVAQVIAHEMAHQWFGDLVTMKWWDDLWLNEAFATWMAFHVIDEWQPQWHTWLDFDVGRIDAMHEDSFASTHPIRATVITADDANSAFDSITYVKGASVIRMIEQYATPEIFRRGISAYLRKHGGGNASADDLWQDLSAVANVPIIPFAHAWIDQPGHPLLMFEMRLTGKNTLWHLSTRQERFAYVATPTPSPLRWPVPFAWDDQHATSEREPVALTQRHVDHDFETGRESVRPISMPQLPRQAFASAYYSGFDAMQANQIAKADPSLRLDWLSDAWALSVAPWQSLESYLALLDRDVPSESDERIIQIIFEKLEMLRDRFVATPAEAEQLQRWVRRTFAPKLAVLTSTTAHDASDSNQALIALYSEILGRLGRDPAIIAQARAVIDQAIGRDELPCEGSLFEALLHVHVEQVGFSSPSFAQYVNWLRTTHSAALREQLVAALGYVSQPTFMSRTIALGLTDAILQQDRPRYYAALLARPQFQVETWHFIVARYDELRKVIPVYGMSRVAGGLGELCDRRLADEIAQFFSHHEAPGAQRPIARAKIEIGVCADFVVRERPTVQSWLKAGEGAK